MAKTKCTAFQDSFGLTGLEARNYNTLGMASGNFGVESTTAISGFVFPTDGQLRGAGTYGMSETTSLVTGTTEYVCTGYYRISPRLSTIRQAPYNSKRQKA